MKRKIPKIFLIAVLSVFLTGAAVNIVYAQQSTTFTLFVEDPEDSALSDGRKGTEAENSPSGSGSKTAAPKTGDEQPTGIWMLTALCAGTICFLSMKQKNNKKA